MDILVVAALALMTFMVFWTFFLAWKRRIPTLSILLLAAGVFLFIYVIQPIYTIMTKDIYFFLDDSQIFMGVIVAALMYACLFWGWMRGMKKTFPPKNYDTSGNWNYGKLYLVGLILGTLGILLFSLFIEQSGGVSEFYADPHMTRAAWQQQTAYVYHAKYFVYPSIVLMIIGLLRGRSTPLRWLPVIGIVVVALIHSILGSARGIFFPLAVSVGLGYYLAAGKRPRMSTVLLGGIIAGVVVLLLVGYREYLYVGASDVPRKSVGEALTKTVGVGDLAFLYRITGNEFIYHTAAICTVNDLNKYHFGINWIYKLTVHLIPRLIWPSKPYYWDSPGIDWDDIRSTSGIQISLGSAPGIVGDFYMQFGWLSVVLFYVLGRISAYLYKLMKVSDDPRTIIIYSMWYAWGLHLFAQDLGAIIVPYVYVLIPTLVAMKWAMKRPRRRLVGPYPGSVMAGGNNMII